MPSKTETSTKIPKTRVFKHLKCQYESMRDIKPLLIQTCKDKAKNSGSHQIQRLSARKREKKKTNNNNNRRAAANSTEPLATLPYYTFCLIPPTKNALYTVQSSNPSNFTHFNFNFIVIII